MVGKRGRVENRGTPVSRASLCALGATVIAAAACSSDPPPRPQLVVVIDTDAPVLGQLGEDSELSPAVAVDTVRIDLIGGDRDVLEHRDVTAADPRDWPISFGVESRSGTSRVVRLRLRAFRASLASRGVLDDVTTIEPPENALVDRIVDVEQPERGVRTVRVVLATACFGAPASFQADARTCVDAQRRDARPSEGVLEGAAPSLVGTAVEARERPCVASPRKGARCIPGGPTILGDPRIDGVVSGPSTSPRRPVLVSPFHLDATEFTVGRYRKLVQRKAVDVLPLARDTSDAMDAFCTWLGADDPANDDYPLNCISYEAAVRACEVEGGRLPTEAQWEHAARGRGRGYLYPWGDVSPECCSASAARVSLPGVPVDCGPGKGPEPAGSHAGTRCVVSDVSMDGVMDLAGSLSEVIADGGLSYADACWTGPGLRMDAVCTDSRLAVGKTGRGGDWSGGRFLLASGLRRLVPMPAITSGFRCAYADSL